MTVWKHPKLQRNIPVTITAATSETPATVELQSQTPTRTAQTKTIAIVMSQAITQFTQTTEVIARNCLMK